MVLYTTNPFHYFVVTGITPWNTMEYTFNTFLPGNL